MNQDVFEPESSRVRNGFVDFFCLDLGQNCEGEWNCFWDLRGCLGCQQSVVSWMSIFVMVRVSTRAGIAVGVVRFLIKETAGGIPMMIFGLLSEVSVIVITETCVVMLRRTISVLVVVMIVHVVVVAVGVISMGIKFLGIESMGIRFVGIVVKSCSLHVSRLLLE